VNSVQEGAIQLPPIELRIFSSGLVSVKKPFAAHPESYLKQEFALPSGTMLETVDVQGVEVSLLRKLSTDGGLVVEVCGIPKTSAPSLSYLVQNAIRWKPLYVIDLSTGELRAYAVTDNLCPFPPAEVTFVMGSPHLASEVGAYKVEAMAMSRGIGVPSPPKVPVSQGELWEYHYEGLIELKGGECIRLPLFDASLELTPVYYWDGEEVVLKHKFVNRLNKPLAPGRVECYEGGSWVGEDTIDWVAIGAEGEIVPQYAPDIEVEEKTTRREEEPERRTVEKEVSVQNHKQTVISIEIVRYLPERANLLSASGKPTQEGGKLTWTLTVGPGESQAISYLYEEILEQKEYRR
jgi:hypothetical protein